MISGTKYALVLFVLTTTLVSCAPFRMAPTSRNLRGGEPATPEVVTASEPQMPGTLAPVNTVRTNSGPTATPATTESVDGTEELLPSPIIGAPATPAVAAIAPATVVVDAAILTPTLKVAYATFQYLENGYTSQLWVMDSIESAPRSVLDLDRENTLLDAGVSWSRDGKRIAYAHVVGLETVAVSTIDVESQEGRTLAFAFPLSVYEGSSTGVDLRHSSWSLDDKWIHATVSVTHPETKVETITEILMSSHGEEFLELPETAEFVAWSTVEPEQYLYIDHPKSPRLGDERLCIGQVGVIEATICVYVEGFVISADHYVSWHAERNVAVFTAINITNRVSVIVAVDLNTGVVEQVLASRGNAAPLLWSPDGKWLLLFMMEDYILWEWDEGERHEVPLPLDAPTVAPLTWLPDGEWLIYQNGYVLAAASPEMPGHRLELVDLSEIGIENRGWLEVSVWAP
jgi:hypothetical protein